MSFTSNFDFSKVPEIDLPEGNHRPPKLLFDQGLLELNDANDFVRTETFTLDYETRWKKIKQEELANQKIDMELLKERKTKYESVGGKMTAQRLCQPIEKDSEEQLITYELSEEAVIRMETKQVLETSSDFDQSIHYWPSVDIDTVRPLDLWHCGQKTYHRDSDGQLWFTGCFEHFIDSEKFQKDSLESWRRVQASLEEQDVAILKQREEAEAEAARVAEEKRKAQEAKAKAEAARVAEEKRKAQEAEAARVAEEKRKAQEAEANAKA